MLPKAEKQVAHALSSSDFASPTANLFNLVIDEHEIKPTHLRSSDQNTGVTAK
jgi:hypothetical protein